MERKIGEIFEFGGDWYQCVKELPTGGCVGCAFFTNAPCAYASEGNGRNIFDHTGLIFKKLEKYGGFIKDNIRGEICQPYTIFDIDRANSRDDRVQFSESKNDFVFVVTKQNQENMEEKKLNLKPFDIQKAREGKPVCTRDGRKARIICFDRRINRSIVALIECDNHEEGLQCYYDNGRYCCDVTSDYDLMMLSEKKEGWVNLYKSDNSNFAAFLGSAYVYNTKEEAINNADPDRTIATVKIEWEE